MHRPLRLVLPAIATVALAAAASVPAAGAAGRHPWATVNVCDPPAEPGAVGVRVLLPRRAGGAQWARVRLEYFDATARVWRPVRSGGDSGWSRIGRGRRPVLGGTTFTFPPPPAGSRIVLRGLVAFEWRRGRRVLARSRVRTTAGHGVRADPSLRVSLRVCEIVR